MTSEIRTNSLTSRAGLSTVTLTDSGPMFSGITTFVDNSGFNLGTGSSIFTPASNTLTFGTNSNERLRIDSSGRVLIGTVKSTNNNTHYDDLTINNSDQSGAQGSTGIDLIASNDAYGGIIFSDEDAYEQGFIKYLHNSDSDSLRFGTNSNPRWEMTKDGYWVPLTDSLYDIGTNAVRVRNGYFDTLYGDGSNLTGITGTTINGNTNNYLITGTGTANTLQGESSFRYDGNGGLDMEGTGAAFFQIKTPNSTDGGIYFRAGSTNYGAISYLHNSTTSLGRMSFRSGGTTKMDLVGAGHLGVGANNLTKTWSLGKAIHIGDSENAIWGEADYAMHLMQNAYYNGGYKYTHSDEATLYSQEDGRHTFKVTASGSADSAITWTEALRIDSSSRVLIGTTVQGTSGADKLTLSTGSSTGITIRSGSSNDGNLYFAMGTTGNETYRGFIQYEHSNNVFRFGTNASERLRIDSTGALGLGVGGITSYFKNNSGNYRQLQIGLGAHFYGRTDDTPIYLVSNGYRDGSNWRYTASTTASQIAMGTNISLFTAVNGTAGNTISFTERLKIANGGVVEVLDSNLSAFATSSSLYGANTSGAKGFYWDRGTASCQSAQPRNTGWSSYYINKHDGNGGSENRYIDFWHNNGQVGNITLSGSGVNYGSNSDYRLKKDDVVMTDGIARVKQLRPIKFKWIKGDVDDEGFFAHETQAVVPIAVEGTKDQVVLQSEVDAGTQREDKSAGEPIYQTMDNSKLVPVLTASIKELITKVETLEQENIALRARVTNLEGN